MGGATGAAAARRLCRIPAAMSPLSREVPIEPEPAALLTVDVQNYGNDPGTETSSTDPGVIEILPNDFKPVNPSSTG